MGKLHFEKETSALLAMRVRDFNSRAAPLRGFAFIAVLSETDWRVTWPNL